MDVIMGDLNSIGYGDWFSSRADEKMLAAHGVARVVSVHKGSYTITDGGEEIFAELSGNLQYMPIFSMTIPMQLYMESSRERRFCRGRPPVN